jgi:hypothetical protein
VQRFDVADGESGETFEVHGAHPDSPAASEVQVGALGFRIEPGNWEELPVRCSFRREPQVDDAEALADLLRSWAVLASTGGFASTGAGTPRWSGRLHSAQLSLQGVELVAVLDLGTCPPQALDSLATSLADFGRDRSALAQVDVGGSARS